MKKAYIKIYCNEFFKEQFKEFINDIKPLNIWEQHINNNSFLFIECYENEDIFKKWYYNIDEVLSEEEFKNTNLSDYDLRNDLIEVI